MKEKTVSLKDLMDKGHVVIVPNLKVFEFVCGETAATELEKASNEASEILKALEDNPDLGEDGITKIFQEARAVIKKVTDKWTSDITFDTKKRNKPSSAFGPGPIYGTPSWMWSE